jgi:NAD+ synthetase
MKVGLLQVNPLVGDLAGNARRILDAARQAAAQGADLGVTPELALMGYPPRDILFDRDFVAAAQETLAGLAANARDLPPLLVGLAEPNDSGTGRPLYNGAALLRAGKVEARFRKTLLPTYDVFDEDRYFEPGDGPGFFACAGRTVAVTICEDIWNDSTFWVEHRYHTDPLARVAEHGADLLVNLSSSPFTIGKQAVRQKMLAHIAAQLKMPVAYCNQVGGNDDLVFAGRSMLFGPDGDILARARAFAEDVLVAELGAGARRIEADDFTPEAEAWSALVLGTRDYVRKCGFKAALLGLSGGVDSSLVAAVAAEALGPGNVLGVLMPSPYSSQGSVDDAQALCANLGMECLTVPIGPLMQGFDAALAEAFAGRDKDVTEENIQSRIRGNLLMALSNKRGTMLLTTGNKSEMAVGYCTIYGDMSGGLAVIADVPKTLVYRICHWLNETRGEVIPQAVLTKAPSAELRPGQKDQDSLPPYEVLDPILEKLLHMEGAPSAIAAGYDPETVRKVARLVKLAEFKRKQAPPGLKITDRAFGTGWRMPIAAVYRDGKS